MCYDTVDFCTHLQGGEHDLLDGRKVALPEDLRLLPQRQHLGGAHRTYHVRHLSTHSRMDTPFIARIPLIPRTHSEDTSNILPNKHIRMTGIGKKIVRL